MLSVHEVVLGGRNGELDRILENHGPLLDLIDVFHHVCAGSKASGHFGNEHLKLFHRSMDVLGLDVFDRLLNKRE